MADITATVFPDNKTSATVQDGTTIVATKVVVPGQQLLKNKQIMQQVVRATRSGD